ncbi:MAG: mercury transporter MerT [Betaproteobacteria bacterium]|nr:mercury transporter MerT [Betaproteobacteria bacterium]
MNQKARLGIPLFASISAALGASACCVVPLALVTMGLGGAWLANLKALEPWQPAFTALALGGLLAAAWRLRKSRTACETDLPCSEQSVWRRQRRVFWLAAAIVTGLLVVPWIAPNLA